MAELVQLDTAASMVGKSEVTLRRLIKAGKIPFHKEKTLTGFIYMVDPDVVRGYYDGRIDVSFEDGEEPVVGQPVEPQTQRSSAVRVAVASESGSLSEYWQKKAELYEDRYNQEMVRHSHTREELGTWRGRAEQAQAMLMKLLPAPSDTQPAAAPQPVKQEESSQVMIFVGVTLVVLLILAGAALFYLKLTGH